MKDQQDVLKAALGPAYTDFNMVLAHEDGRPYEERQIADKLRRFHQKHNLPPVVFHSLRHCSTSVKLQISGGNIKAVQGDTGHAKAGWSRIFMLTPIRKTGGSWRKKWRRTFFSGEKQITRILDLQMPLTLHLPFSSSKTIQTWQN